MRASPASHAGFPSSGTASSRRVEACSLGVRRSAHERASCSPRPWTAEAACSWCAARQGSARARSPSGSRSRQAQRRLSARAASSRRRSSRSRRCTSSSDPSPTASASSRSRRQWRWPERSRSALPPPPTGSPCAPRRSRSSPRRRRPGRCSRSWTTLTGPTARRWKRCCSLPDASTPKAWRCCSSCATGWQHRSTRPGCRSCGSRGSIAPPRRSCWEEAA